MAKSDMSQRPSPLKTGGGRKSEFAVFWWAWFTRPKAVGAFSPSSRALAKAMVDQVPSSDGQSDLVLELGPGTGSVTAALIERGIKPESLVSIEFNRSFLAHLSERFPGSAFLEGDATKLEDALRPHGWWKRGGYRAIVSSLPLRNMSASMHGAILKSCMDLLRPGGVFIQFTYGPTNSVHRDVLRELGLSARQMAFVWLNLPPAGVWVMRKQPV